MSTCGSFSEFKAFSSSVSVFQNYSLFLFLDFFYFILVIFLNLPFNVGK